MAVSATLNAQTTTLDVGTPSDWTSFTFIQVGPDPDCGRVRATLSNASLAVGETYEIILTADLGQTPNGGAFGALFTPDNDTPNSFLRHFTLANVADTNDAGSGFSDGVFYTAGGSPSVSGPAMVNGNNYTLTYEISMVSAGNYTIGARLFDNTSSSLLYDYTATPMTHANPGLDNTDFELTFQQETIVCNVVPEPSAAVLGTMILFFGFIRRNRR